MSEEFTWSSYPDHLRELFEWMLISDELSDVTFITDDSVMVKANRFVLSAASPLLREILKIDCTLKSEEKVVYLKGIQYSEIRSIIQFIYLGVTKCKTNRLIELRTAAENLQIEDLKKQIVENVEILNNCVKYAKNELLETSENLENKYATSSEESGFEDSSIIRMSAKNIDTNVVEIYENNFVSASNSEINSAVNSDFKYSCIFIHCDYKAKQRGNLNTHIQSMHDDKKYQCEVCNKEYTSKGNLQAHKKSAHKTKRNSTEYRQLHEDSKGHYRKYPYTEVKHDGRTFYQCDKCKEEFEETDKNKYAKHMNNCGRSCSFCGKTYKRKQSWQRCEASHTNGYRYFCSWCGKGFMCNQRMGRHERIHTGQTPYQCNECGKRFKQSNQLKSHTRIHTGETPFQCDKCCKKFKFASTKSHHKCVLNS